MPSSFMLYNSVTTSSLLYMFMCDHAGPRCPILKWAHTHIHFCVATPVSVPMSCFICLGALRQRGRGHPHSNRVPYVKEEVTQLACT